MTSWETMRNYFVPQSI